MTIIRVKHFLYLLNIAMLAVLGFYALNYTNNQYFRTHDHWARYLAIDPVNAVNANSEDVEMRSVMDVYRKVGMEWSDILRCRRWGTELPFTYVSVYKSENPSAVPGIARQSLWNFPQQKLPRYDAECYINSVIVYRVGRFVVHDQTMDSGKFRVMTKL